jgi:hypothetical protein
MPIERLRKLPEEKHEEQTVGDTQTSYTTYRASLADGGLLVVVQAFIPTLAWPTYISFAGWAACTQRDSLRAKTERLLMHLMNFFGNTVSPNKSLQPTALWRCASMSILISVFLTVAQPRSLSGG